MSTVYVGVDVSKAKLDAALAWSAQQRQAVGRFDNTEVGIAKLVQRVTQLGPGEVTFHLVVEPTGGYEARMVRCAYAQGWLVSVVNPWLVRRWAQGMGVRAKTDRIDAQVLSWYGAATQPPGQEPLGEAAQQLDELLRRRQDLEQLRQAERNRAAVAAHKPHTPPAVRQSLVRTLQALDEELAAIEDAIQQLLKQELVLRQQVELLRSLPGVGERVALPLLALLHRFTARTAGQGTAKQLVALVGLDPQPHDSGSSVHQRPTISRKGDAHLRSLLYLGALGGKRGKYLKPIYQQLVDRGKRKKVALVACARRMLVWAWAVFRTQIPFDPSRLSQIAHVPT
jgi:transposase